jgi:hypothetical protein
MPVPGNLRVPVVKKTPSEVRTQTFDFTDKLPVGDSLTGVASMTYPSGLTEVTSTRAGNLVNSRMSGGTNGRMYRIVCSCGTASGDTLNLQCDVLVDSDAN